MREAVASVTVGQVDGLCGQRAVQCLVNFSTKLVVRICYPNVENQMRPFYLSVV